MKFINGITAVIVACGALVSLSGCSGFQQIIKNEPSSGVRYSERANLPFETDRKYQRMTRNRFEEEADIGEQAGSLWVMEGQGAYLFAQNQARMTGDLLNIQLEGAPKQQLTSKVRVISKLLERLEKAKSSTSVRGPAAVAGAMSASTQTPTPAEEATQPNSAGTKSEETANGKDPIAAIQTVPTRIVEQLKDGSYRVKGVQPFMIGKREYRIIVTGIVRQEDFDDSGIKASKLLDSQFDIVSSKKGTVL